MMLTMLSQVNVYLWQYIYLCVDLGGRRIMKKIRVYLDITQTTEVELLAKNS